MLSGEILSPPLPQIGCQGSIPASLTFESPQPFLFGLLHLVSLHCIIFFPGGFDMRIRTFGVLPKPPYRALSAQLFRANLSYVACISTPWISLSSLSSRYPGHCIHCVRHFIPILCTRSPRRKLSLKHIL